MSVRIIGVDDPLARAERFLAWLREHGIEPNDTYEVRIDDGEMTAYRYARNDEGRCYLDASGVVAVREPLVVRTRRPVPA